MKKLIQKERMKKKTNFCYKFIKAKNKKKLVHPEGEDYPCYIDVATAAAAAANTVLHCDHRKKEKKNTKWTWKA